VTLLVGGEPIPTAQPLLSQVSLRDLMEK